MKQVHTKKRKRPSSKQVVSSEWRNISWKVKVRNARNQLSSLTRDNAVTKPIKSFLRFTKIYPALQWMLERWILRNHLSMQRIKKLVGKDDPVILEIGAHIGQDSERFLKTFKHMRLYCFEPNPRTIVEFMSRLGNEKRCTLVPIAISDKNGRATMFKAELAHDKTHTEYTPSSTIKTPKNMTKEYTWLRYKKDVTVKTMRLDDWVRRNKISMIDFIWADVEGAEAELIAGGQETLNKKTRYFYTEYHDGELMEGQPTLKEILASLPNFRVLGFYENNVLLENKNL